MRRIQTSFWIISCVALFIFTNCVSHHYCTSQDSVQDEHIVIKEQAIDSTLHQTILPYKTQIDKDLNIPIAATSIPLEKNIHCNNLAELVYESLQWYADSVLGKPMNYMILINYGGLRSNIPQGSITKRTIYELMPFDNGIVILELTDEQLQNLLVNTKNNHKILLKSTANEPTHVVVTSDYLYQGGDNCFFLKDAKKLNTSNYLIRDAIIQYCTMKKQLDIPCFHSN